MLLISSLVKNKNINDIFLIVKFMIPSTLSPFFYIILFIKIIQILFKYNELFFLILLSHLPSLTLYLVLSADIILLTPTFYKKRIGP